MEGNMPYCEKCGSKIKETSNFCQNCGTKVEFISEIPSEKRTEEPKSQTYTEEQIVQQSQDHERTPPPPRDRVSTPFSPVVEETQNYNMPDTTQPQTIRNQWIALIISLFFPGLGQVYVGQLQRGLIFLAATMIISIILGALALVPLLWGMYDAYSIAKKVNNREGAYIPSPATNYIIYFVAWVIFLILAAIIPEILFGSSTFSDSIDYSYYPSFDNPRI